MRKAVTRSRSARRFVRSLAPALLVAVLAAAALPGPPAVVAMQGSQTASVPALMDATPVSPADVAGAEDTLGQRPSIAYEEAMAHADDRIAFEPGGRVDVGFRPRAADRWPVDGRAPRALPAGRATGRQMATSRQGTTWADVGSAAPDPAATPDPSLSPDPVVSPAPAVSPTTAPLTEASSSPESTSGPVDAPAGEPVVPATGVAYTVPGPAPAIDPAAAAGLTRQVFGFLPYWELSGASTKLNYDVLSTIAYFSVGADSKGNLRKKNSDGSTSTGWGGWTSSSLTSVINTAHSHGTRVVLTLSVFAWTTSQASVQKALLGSSTARLNFARQAAAAVRDRGADGINLDFEPLASTYSDEFVALLKTVRSELNKVGSGYQLTYDTTGYIGNYPLEASVAAGAADAIFIMGYDYRTSGSTYAGSIDPLSGTGYDLADTVRAYTARVSPSRIILGIPWYGRAWSTVSDAVRSKNQSGAKYGHSTAVTYENVVDLVARYGRRWDGAERSPYLVYRRENCTSTYGCVTSWRQVYFDDAASMKLRYALVNDYNLRGAGMWALGYDGGNQELYRAVSESFLVDKAAPQAGVKNLAAKQVDEGFVVSWTARDATVVATYDVQVSADGGAWTTWSTGTSATSDVWLGADGHGYAFRVRATDTKGNAGAWNVASVYDPTPSIAVGGFGRVTTDGLGYRTGPDTSAAKLGTLSAGTIVAFTRGPVTADGYTWYEVTQPIAEWLPVSFVERGVWLAVRSSTTTHVSAYRAPNSTIVDAGLKGMDFGTGASAVGTDPAAVSRRQLSPNGDGIEDGLRLRWTNSSAFDTMLLKVYRLDGTLVGSRTVRALAAGARTWDWDGRAGASVVPDGRYVLQLVGTAAGRTYRAPSSRPVTTAQVAAYAVTVDTSRPHTTYVPLAPVRLLDTRPGGTGLAGPFTSGTARTFQVTGRGKVPAGAIAVTGNLTVTGQTSSGYVALTPDPVNSPTTSTLNVPRGDTRANGVTVRLSAKGTLSATFKGAAGATTALVFDVTGYFLPGTAGATYVPLAPVRLLDTRPGGTGLAGPFTSGTARTFQVTGRGKVPAGAIAVTGNLTVTGQTSSGYVALTPDPVNSPTTSTLNVPRGDTRANGVTVRLSAKGTLSATFKGAAGATTALVFDVTGYFLPGTAGATYVPLAPVRLLDTRPGGTGLAGPFTSGTARTFQVTGRGKVPAGAIAVTGNLTVTGQTSSGYVALTPDPVNSPTTSTLNVPRGDTRANGVTVRLSAKGTLSATFKGAAGATTALVFDVTGYFLP